MNFNSRYQGMARKKKKSSSGIASSYKKSVKKQNKEKKITKEKLKSNKMEEFKASVMKYVGNVGKGSVSKNAE